jgi:hypothetical protein
VGVCICGFRNVWMCVCVGFYCVGVCMCEFCNVWVCVCVCFVMCGCVYVWVFIVWVCVCVGVLVICARVLVFTVFCVVSFMYIYSYLLLV